MKKFVVQHRRGVLKIFQTVSGNFEPTYKHYKIVIHGLPDQPHEYEMDGKDYKITRKNSLLGVMKIRTTSYFKEIAIKV